MTFDAHKLFGASLTSSVFITQDGRILLQANDVSGGEYLFHIADAPRTTSVLLDAVDREVERWTKGTPAAELNVRGWVTQQWQRFLDSLPDDLRVTQLAELDRTFRFTQSGNSEILCAWLGICAHNRYGAADKAMAEFLLRVGRRKFLKPIYTELAKSPEGLRRAKEIYALARPRYHAVATRTLDELLNWGK